MGKSVIFCKSREDARNRAIRWLEERGGAWGGRYEVQTNRFPKDGPDQNQHEVGINTTDGTRRTIRVEWDPTIGPHYNVQAGKGAGFESEHFAFPLDSESLPGCARARLYDNQAGAIEGYAGSGTAAREKLIADGARYSRR